MSTQFQNANKIKFMPLPYIGMFDLDVIYQTSDAELLYQVLYKLNEIAKSQNVIIDNFKSVLEWAKEQIENYTKDQLETWLNDGTLTNMIKDYIDSVYMSLNDKIEDNDKDIININSRIDSLIIGGTVSDSEVVDARTGDGITYPTLGDRINKGFENIKLTHHELFTGDNFKLGNVDEQGNVIEDSSHLVLKDYFIPEPLTTWIHLENDYSVVVYEYDENNVFLRKFPITLDYHLTYLETNKKKYLITCYLNNPQDVNKIQAYHGYYDGKNVSLELFGHDGLPTTNTQVYFELMINFCKLNTTTVQIEKETLYDLSKFNFNFYTLYYTNYVINLGSIINARFTNLKLKSNGSTNYLLSGYYLRDVTFDNCYLDGNHECTCLTTSFHSNLNITNSIICRFSYVGIDLHSGHECLISNCKIYQVTFQEFNDFIETHSNGICVRFELNATDNQLTNNVICYCAGLLLSIEGTSNFMSNNHFYNDDHSYIDIHSVNNCFTNNYFDSVPLHDRRGGNMYVGNSFTNFTDDYVIVLQGEDYYGRQSNFNSNIMTSKNKKYINADMEGLYNYNLNYDLNL